MSTRHRHRHRHQAGDIWRTELHPAGWRNGDVGVYCRGHGHEGETELVGEA